MKSCENLFKLTKYGVYAIFVTFVSENIKNLYCISKRKSFFVRTTVDFFRSRHYHVLRKSEIIRTKVEKTTKNEKEVKCDA